MVIKIMLITLIQMVFTIHGFDNIYATLANYYTYTAVNTGCIILSRKALFLRLGNEKEKQAWCQNHWCLGVAASSI